MDAMITRCVDELNKHDEEMQKLRGTEQVQYYPTPCHYCFIIEMHRSILLQLE